MAIQMLFQVCLLKRRRSGHFTDKPAGLKLHKPNMDPYNDNLQFPERRSLKYYSVRGSMPSVQEDPNMHIAAHLYASDRNSLFVMYE